MLSQIKNKVLPLALSLVLCGFSVPAAPVCAYASTGDWEEEPAQQTDSQAADEELAITADQLEESDGRFVVTYSEENAPSDNKAVEKQMEDAGLEVDDARVLTDDAEFAVVELSDEQDLEQAASALQNLEGAEAVQPDYEYTLDDEGASQASTAITAAKASASSANKKSTSIDDNLASMEYQLENIDAYRAWDLARGDESLSAQEETPVCVAILDTGLNYASSRRHEDLQDVSDGGNVYYQYGYNAAYNNRKGRLMCNGGWTDEEQYYRDYMGHGTTVASAIAAQANNGVGIAGSSYNARVLPINIFDRPTYRTDRVNSEGLFYYDATAHTSTLLAGFNYALSKAKKLNIRVINMSLGGKKANLDGLDQAVKRIIKKAYNAGIVVVASSGNDGDKQGAGKKYYPASFPYTLSVGSTNSSHVISAFSQYNSAVDLCAPGEGVLLAKGGWARNPVTGALLYAKTNAYDSVEGTSFSSPIVCGVVALVLSVNQDLTPLQVQRILTYTANDLGVSGKDDYYGYGEVNAYHAVLAALSGKIPNKKHYESQLHSSTCTYWRAGKIKTNCEACGFDFSFKGKKRAISWRSLTSKVGYLNVKWAKAPGVKGYYVKYRVKGAAKWRTCKLPGQDSIKLKMDWLARGVRYQVKVVAYTMVDGKKVLSRYSSVKSRVVR